MVCRANQLSGFYMMTTLAFNKLTHFMPLISFFAANGLVLSDVVVKVLQTVNPLSANPTKWPNTLKQFLGFCRGLALKRLNSAQTVSTFSRSICEFTIKMSKIIAVVAIEL